MPAVTRVEECTRAETGVGAAMAAGSQAEKGSCALLVIAAIMSSNIISPVTLNLFWTKFHCPAEKARAQATIRRASPIRFVIRVIMPAAIDLSFM